MSKPFQFSMRRMLVAVALFCLSMGLFGQIPRATSSDGKLGLFFGGFIALGAAIGTMFGRPLWGMVVSLVGVVAVALLA
jgi:hypothetical protein